ncbi:hypothetical protein DU000_03195 [Parvibium lacunae]|uniref:Uncharacterized protein n=2 Tax=Parvibium lacunae TaxID=1888893 RepID=A0A368L7Q0_9BURK|nr:hypothetical protein DU000_03195 [Parvibium lacunae]
MFVPGNSVPASHVPIESLEAHETDKFVAGLCKDYQNLLTQVYRKGYGARAAASMLGISSATFAERERQIQWLWDNQRSQVQEARYAYVKKRLAT